MSECVGSRFHSPTPLVVNEVGLEDGTVVTLCSLCADNLAVYVTAQQQYGWRMPWERRRTFGNLIRALADSAHQRKAS